VHAGLSLWGLEAAAAVLAALPVAGALAAVTGHLPSVVPLWGPRGFSLVLEAAWVEASATVPWALAGTGVLVLSALVVAPLLLAGVVGALENGRTGPLSMLRAGVRRWGRTAVWQLVYLAACTGGAVGAVAWLGPESGGVAAGACLVLLGGVRDAGAVALGRTRRPLAMLRAMGAMVADRPVELTGAFLVQAMACLLLCVGALRLQLLDRGTSAAAAAGVLAGVQALMAGRCIVRCWWLGRIVDVHGEIATGGGTRKADGS
jgi:hypothetical protein